MVENELEARLRWSLASETSGKLFQDEVRPLLTQLYRSQVIDREITRQEKAALALRIAMSSFAFAAATMSNAHDAFGPLSGKQAPFFRAVMEDLISALEAGVTSGLEKLQ